MGGCSGGLEARFGGYRESGRGIVRVGEARFDEPREMAIGVGIGAVIVRRH